MTPQRQKAAAIDVLTTLLQHQADNCPVLVLFEDAHWMDPSTQEMLTLLIDRIHMLPVLCLISYRPDFSPPWKDRDRVSIHTLGRLGHKEVERIVALLTGGKALPAEVLDQIVEKTDGVPLFVEELTKTVLEKGVFEETDGRYILKGPMHALTIPSTLNDSLMARLDRLGHIKEVAQTAACIGREFQPGLLAEISSLDRGTLEKALNQLVTAELIFRRDAKDDKSSYVFKHALVQDAAYESLPGQKASSGARPASPACWLSDFRKQWKPSRSKLAHHYNGCRYGCGCDFHNGWPRVTGRLPARDFRKPISHLSKALELTADIENVEQRQGYEIDVRTMLGAATTALHGWPAIEGT